MLAATTDAAVLMLTRPRVIVFHAVFLTLPGREAYLIYIRMPDCIRLQLLELPPYVQLLCLTVGACLPKESIVLLVPTSHDAATNV